MAATDKDIDRQCTSFKEAGSCLKNFTRKCLTTTQKQLANSLSDGAQKLQKEFCTPGSAFRQSYLKHAPCLNTALKEQKPCIKDLQVSFEKVTEAKWDKRIPLGCCAYRRTRDCIVKLIEQKCGQETVKFVNDFLRAALSRLPELACQKYSLSSATCKELPPFGTAPKGGRSTSVLNRLLSAYTNI